jgi:plasmid stabilization system protein ParE
LGEQFLDCVDACIQQLRRTPARHVKIFEDYRRAMVRRFPYIVFYEYDGTTLTIYGVLHTSRDPEKWRERLA